MYVVAGVTGRVGSVVARELLAQQHRVTGIARDAERGVAWAIAGDQERSRVRSARQCRVPDPHAARSGRILRAPPGRSLRRGVSRRSARAMADAMATAVRASRVPHVVLLSAVAASLADGNGPAKDLHYLERALRTTRHDADRSPGVLVSGKCRRDARAGDRGGDLPELRWRRRTRRSRPSRRAMSVASRPRCWCRLRPLAKSSTSQADPTYPATSRWR